MQWLTKSWLVGRFRGTEIRLHFSMLFSLVFAYLIIRPDDLRGVLASLLGLGGIVLCVLVHELGHTLAAQLLGIEVRSIVLWPLGGFTNLSRKPERPFHSLLVSGSGPLANIVILVVLTTVYFGLLLAVPATALNQVPFLMRLLSALAILNLVLVVFNLLPVYPLDGGKMMRSGLQMIVGKPNADLITMIVSIPVLLCLVAFAVLTGDYILLAICVLIALAVGTLSQRTLQWINLALQWINLAVNYLFRRAGYHYLQGDFDRVIRHLTQQIERDPAKVQPYLGRAIAHLHLLNKEMARADLERALRLDPNNAVAVGLLGNIYGMDKNYDAALKLGERDLQLRPNSSIPFFNRGGVYLELGEFRTALESFDKAVGLMPPLPPIVYLLRSMARFRLGDLDSAHTEQDQALRLSPKDALVMFDVNLPVVEGYLDWAEDYYGRVISGKTHLPWAHQGRADAYRINGEYERAISDYTSALELSPREAGLYLGRGKAYQALGERARAADDFRKAKEGTGKSHQKRQAEQCLRELG